MSHYETNPISVIINGVKQAFAHSQQLAIILIILPMALGVVNFVGQMFGNAFGASISTVQDRSSALLAVGVVLFILAILLQIFTQVLYTGIQSFAMLKISRGEDETFNKAFEHAFSKLWKIVLIHLTLFVYTLPYSMAVSALVVLSVVLVNSDSVALTVCLPISIILGTLLVILIFRVYLRFSFAMTYMFDGTQTTTEAFNKSKQLTKGRLSEVFGVMTIGSLVPFISALTMTSGMAILFKQLTEARDAKAELPRQHILNYIVPAIAFMFFGFLVLIFVALLATTA
ncbi:MAG: hypothetical protein AAB624_02700 [Patescibacteria group bacterium]